MHHQHAIAGLCPSRRSERERERGKQARVKEARKSMLSCILSIQVNYMFCAKNLPWALRFHSPVSSSHSSFIFAKEEILAGRSRHSNQIIQQHHLTNVVDYNGRI